MHFDEVPGCIPRKNLHGTNTASKHWITIHRAFLYAKTACMSTYIPSRALLQCSMAPIDNVKANCLCGSVVVQTKVRRCINHALLD